MTKRFSIAVTGASGFVGRTVLAALLNHGLDVAAVTRDRRRLIEFESRIRIFEGDVSETNPDLCKILARHNVLLHLAWGGLPNYRSRHHFESELPNQYRFLKEIVAHGLRSLVVTGTCFEYGIQNGELSEEHVTAPGNPYSYAKDALRRQLFFLQAEKQFDMTWARLFYMYGKGQTSKSIYGLLSAAVERNDRYFDMSGGEQLRDYLPIDKVGQYLTRLCLEQTNVGIVNVCSGTPRSMRGIVEEWLRENNWQIELRLGRYPYPDYEPFAFWGSTRKLLSILKDR